MAELDKQRAVDLLNRILESELAGVVRYTHYAFLVFGHNRIPIVSWLREQAAESLTHAFREQSINRVFDDAPSMFFDLRIDEIAEMSSQPFMRAFLVRTHQARVTIPQVAPSRHRAAHP
jgi:hypothetical protein